jgi:hypothetical protein
MEELTSNGHRANDRDFRQAPDAFAEELDGLSMPNRRRARVDEFEEDAISRSDSYAAVIGMGSAYLQRVFEALGAALLEEIDSHPLTVQELRALNPEIRMLVKLRSAIETDLEVQALASGDQSVGFASGLKRKEIAGKRALFPQRFREND